MSWLDRDLRARRSELLRGRWRDLAVILLSLGLSAAGFGMLLRDSPFLLGLTVGTYIGAVTVSAVVFLSVVDGTFHPRLGRLMERLVGTDLRRVSDVYGVISDVSFEHVNVDHVVLAPQGCLAVEVKSGFSGRRELDHVPGLGAKIAQARDGAARVQRLLRSRGVDLPVRPVLLLTGPGAPLMPPVVQSGDVTVSRVADPTAWTAALTAADRLDLETARQAATELLTYREQRTAYERCRPQQLHSSSAAK